MVELTRKSAERMARAVRTVEQHFVSLSSDPVRLSGDQQPKWFKLTEDLGVTSYEADANPCKWSASAGTGAGALSVDTGTTQTVRDVTESMEAPSGSYVLCLPIGATDGTVWQVLAVAQTSSSLTEFGGVTTEECDDILVTAYSTLSATTTTTTATAAEVLDALPNPGELTPVPPDLPSPAWCVTTGEPFPFDPQARVVNPGFTWAAGDTLRMRVSADGAYWVEGVISGDFAAICTACADGIAAPFGYEVAFSGFVGAASLNDTFTLEHVEDVTYCRWQADVDPNTHAGVAHIVHLIWWNWVAEKYERTIILYSDELDEFDAYIPLVEWYEYFETNRPNCLPIVAEANYAFPLEEYAEPVNDEAAAFNAAVDATGVTCTVTAITVAP